jgi:hypothetical protein
MLLCAQDIPEEKRNQREKAEQKRQKKSTTATQDTTQKGGREKEGEFAKAEKDTSKLIPVESNLYWYDLDNRLSLKTDSSRNEIYRSADETKQIYKDMSDIFQSQPFWLDFNLAEVGRPAYIAMLNSYPHQNSFYFNNIPVNNELHGMYNSQMIPLNFIQFTEVDYTQGNLRNFAAGNGPEVNVTSNSEQYQEPWTKILYKSGGYGYSDLDISFAIPYSSTFAVQLGGLNRFFDGTQPGSGFKGENYRAEVTWQYSPHLYIRTQIFLNRLKFGLASYDFTEKIAQPHILEHQDDYLVDLTWVQNDSSRQRLHVLFYHSFYSRKYEDTYSSYIFVTKNIRYGLDVNYNLFLSQNELLLGAGTVMPKILGDPFRSNPTISDFNLYAKLRVPLADNLTFRAQLQTVSVEDLSPQIIPAAGIDLKISERQQGAIYITQGKRLPNATERFWDFDSLFGNRNLTAESYFDVHARYDHQITDQ